LIGRWLIEMPWLRMMQRNQSDKFQFIGQIQGLNNN